MLDAVTVEDYDPHWPQLFEVVRSRIAAVLDKFAISIEHVGSTAVPGLAAKPIVDIDVLLRSSIDLPIVVRMLAGLGYEHEGDLGITGREAFRIDRDPIHHHLYVCLPESCEFARHIAFRDYLRTHSTDANAYAVLKRKLATTFASDRKGYNQAKSEFVQSILQRT